MGKKVEGRNKVEDEHKPLANVSKINFASIFLSFEANKEEFVKVETIYDVRLEIMRSSDSFLLKLKFKCSIKDYLE